MAAVHTVAVFPHKMPATQTNLPSFCTKEELVGGWTIDNGDAGRRSTLGALNLRPQLMHGNTYLVKMSHNSENILSG